MTNWQWVWWMCEFIYFSRICVFVLFPSYLIFFQRRLECCSWGECERNKMIFKLESIMYFMFLVKDKVVCGVLEGAVILKHTGVFKGSLSSTLCLFPVFVLSCGRAAEWIFDPWVGHWNHVCCGAPHPCCTHGLLCEEKQRRQVCRYAAAAPATRHNLHGKRSVTLSPGLRLLVFSLQEMNQNNAHEKYSTYRGNLSNLVTISMFDIFKHHIFSGSCFGLASCVSLVDLFKDWKCAVGLNPGFDPVWKCSVHAIPPPSPGSSTVPLNALTTCCIFILLRNNLCDTVRFA